jgi:hypothetical protein
LLKIVRPRKFVSLPILSGLLVPGSWVVLKLPSGVGVPGFRIHSESHDGDRICAPAPRMTPGGCVPLPLPALPAV